MEQNIMYASTQINRRYFSFQEFYGRMNLMEIA